MAPLCAEEAECDWNKASGADPKTSLIKVKNSLEVFKRKFIQKEEIICQVEHRIMLNIESNKQTKRKD